MAGTASVEYYFMHFLVLVLLDIARYNTHPAMTEEEKVLRARHTQ